MKIILACPAPPGSRKGNRVTAQRWARLLRELGHRPHIVQNYDGSPCDVLVALHARRSYPAVVAYRQLHPKGPLVVALTGTDLYRDLRASRRAPRSLDLADRLVLLQPCGRTELSAQVRRKARVIYQSAVASRSRLMKREDRFDVCVLGHLRSEKDPLRTAKALQFLPPDSRVWVTQAGEALSPGWAKRARAAMARDERYRWVGELPRDRARKLLARSRLLVLSSRMEGGANVISEAVAEGVPVLASRIPGSVGLLGRRYPGFFPVGDTRALAMLLRRAETNAAYYERLRRWCEALRPRFEPAREREAWAALLDELIPTR